MKIVNIERECRLFGPNAGEPVLRLDIEEGSGTTEENTKLVLDTIGRLEWIYIRGDMVKGLSSFINALGQLKIKIELDLKATGSTPSWINKPDLVFLRYENNLNFNYFTLRKKDAILFKVISLDTLDNVKDIFEELTLTPSIKWIISSADYYGDCFELVTKYPRCRLTREEDTYGTDYGSIFDKEEVKAGSV